jgi:hypothetical protein
MCKGVKTILKTLVAAAMVFGFTAIVQARLLPLQVSVFCYRFHKRFLE